MERVERKLSTFPCSLQHVGLKLRFCCFKSHLAISHHYSRLGSFFLLFARLLNKLNSPFIDLKRGGRRPHGQKPQNLLYIAIVVSGFCCCCRFCSSILQISFRPQEFSLPDAYTHPFKNMPITALAYFINTLDSQSSGRGRGWPNNFKVGDLFWKIYTSLYANF